MSDTLAALQNIAPHSPLNLQMIADTIDSLGGNYAVDTPARIEAFIAQAAEETDDFKTLQEYASGNAYEGRADLGNTQPGDGARFKGRGIFQITGRSNYKTMSEWIYGDDRLLDTPELLEQEYNATLSALYYWMNGNLAAYADNGDFSGLTKAINGGLNGWKTRLSYWDSLKLFFQNVPTNLQGAVITAGSIGITAAVIVGMVYLAKYIQSKVKL